MAADFFGLPVHSIGNRALTVDCLARGGLRIVRLRPAGRDDNLLAEVPDLHWPTPYGMYHLRGGHRLWHAPEAPLPSDVPDDGDVQIEATATALTLRAVEQPTGLEKTIAVALCGDEPRLSVRHTLRNLGAEPLEVAPWAITMLPLGGRAIVAQQRAVTDQRLPDRHVVVWPYTRWRDTRLHIDDDFIVVDAQASSAALKIGCLSAGWIGYLRGDFGLIKRFDPQPDRPHPDRNCNAEVYCNQRFIELESLGASASLAPGAVAEHVEQWKIIAGLEPPTSPERLIELVKSRHLI